jgi:DNA-binding CsgD family transcriptional regulator
MAAKSLPVSISSKSFKNCPRCGLDFYGVEMICHTCRRPTGLQYGQHFSVRERQVADRISEGKTNKAIGGELHLAEGTIKVYIRNMFIKTGMSNRTALAIEWLRRCDISNKSE